MRWLIGLAVMGVLIGCVATPRASAQVAGLFVSGRYQELDQMPPGPVVAANTQSIFLLRKGVLAKYNAVTHQPEGVLELFGKPAEAPTDWLFKDMEASNAFRGARAERLAPAAMTVSDTAVEILIGDRYFRVDPAAMTITLATPIAAPGIPSTTPDQYVHFAKHPLVSGPTVSYRVITPYYPDNPCHLLAFERATGNVLATAMFPPEMQGGIANWEEVPDARFFREIYRLMDEVPVTMVPTDDSLFVFRLGVVGKFDAKTLKLVKTFQLYGPPATLNDPAHATVDEKVAVNLARARLLMPAVLSVSGAHLNIIMGDDFFSVNTGDMTISKKAVLVQTDEGDLLDRVNYLARRGQPAAAAVGDAMYLIEGTQILKADGAAGEVTVKELPELLARSLIPVLPVTETRIPAPQEGANLSVRGLLAKHADPAGDYWTVLDQFYGEVVLQGKGLDGLLANIEKPDYSVVSASGVYHKVGEKHTLTPTAMRQRTEMTLNGTLGTQEQGGKTILTLRMPNGVEYTLVGDALSELRKHPKYLGTAMTISGTFVREQPDMPLIGNAYLKITRYAGPQSRVEIFPVAIAGAPDALVVTRAGAVAVFDPATLAVKASADLFPPMPQVKPETQQAYYQERAKRIAPAILTLHDRQLFVAVGATLFNTTLDCTAVTSVNMPTAWGAFLTDTAYCLVMGETLTAFDTKDVTQRYNLTLPKEMSTRLFPSIDELQRLYELKKDFGRSPMGNNN